VKRLLLASLLLAAWLPAQEAKPAPPTIVAKLLTVKNLPGRQLEQALNLVRMFNVNIQQSELGVIAISGTEPAVTAAEAALSKLDVPKPEDAARDVEVIIWVVAASSKFQADALTPALEPVIKQMRGIFQYPNYRILDTQIIRQRVNLPGTRNSQADTAAQIVNPAKEGSTYTCATNFFVEADPAAKVKVFRFNNFIFRCYYPATPAQHQAFIRTDLDLREGQKAVVGKSSIGDESALFLVMTVRQVD
jgi:hypothetical protein